MPYKDFTIVCGLSKTGNPVGGKSTDWQHFGIPVHADEIWTLEFQCCHKAGDPNANVIGSFVYYDRYGTYRATTPGPIAPLLDSTSWQPYSFQQAFQDTFYVFPAIWWHHDTLPLDSRYLAAVQMARIDGVGAIAVIQPDIYLTLGTDPLTVPDKRLSGAHAHVGPPALTRVP